MALTSFLNVNGLDFPCPKVGFQYILSTTVNGGRNSNDAVVGQRVGRDAFKFNQMEWAMLDPDTVHAMMQAVENFFVPVTFEDFRTGQPITHIFYRGDVTATPLYVDPETHIITKYSNVKFNLIDCKRD